MSRPPLEVADIVRVAVANFQGAPHDALCLEHCLGKPQIPFAQLNLHRARVHRNHGRPRPNGFTGRAQNSRSGSSLSRQRIR